MHFIEITLLVYCLCGVNIDCSRASQADVKLCTDVDHICGRMQRQCQKNTEHVIASCDEASPTTAKAWYGDGGIFNLLHKGSVFEVYCDMKTDGGKWLVFQRRKDGSVNFYRNWENYLNGFGDVDGEFWLGLDKVHKLTSTGHYELRIDLGDWDGNKRYAKYSTFFIGNANLGFKLSVKGYHGNAGDSLSYHSGMKFSTPDKDFDSREESISCAVHFKGAWWYKSCHFSNLNGLYMPGGSYDTDSDGVEWYHWKGRKYSLKFVEMKMRKL